MLQNIRNKAMCKCKCKRKGKINKLEDKKYLMEKKKKKPKNSGKGTQIQ